MISSVAVSAQAPAVPASGLVLLGLLLALVFWQQKCAAGSEARVVVDDQSTIAAMRAQDQYAATAPTAYSVG